MNKVVRCLCTAFMLIMMLFCDLNTTYAQEVAKKETVVYVSGNSYVIKLPKVNEKVEWRSTNKRIVNIKKVYGTNGRYAKISAEKMGRSVISAEVKNKVYKYIVYVEPKEKIEKYEEEKSKYSLVKLKSRKDTVVARVKVCNGEEEELEYEPCNILQRKQHKEWKDITQKSASAYIARTIYPNTSLTHSVLISELYGELPEGKYRMGVLINGKMQYVSFKIK